MVRSHLMIHALLGALAFIVLGSGIALAHEEREVAGYEMEVGFIDEPVFAGEKSGLELFVHRNEQPVTGLESTLMAEVIYQDRRLRLPLNVRFDEEGAYESVFFPTAAGPYTFHITGSLEGTTIDESFTSSQEGFGAVGEAQAGQFPIQFPPMAELVDQARRGAAASEQVPIALGLGAAGLVIGVVALGVALAGRRRPG